MTDPLPRAATLSWLALCEAILQNRGFSRVRPRRVSRPTPYQYHLI